MPDLIFVVVIVAFFAVCVQYVNWCDRIIGPDELTAEQHLPDQAPVSSRDDDMTEVSV